MFLPPLARRLRDRLSIRQQSAALTILLSLATVAIMSIATAFVVRQHAVETTNVELRNLATSMAGRLDRQMFERTREICNLASLAPASGLLRDAARLRAFLEQMQTTQPNFAWIGYASEDGVVQASTGSLLEGDTVAARPWFSEGLQGPVVHDIQKAALLAPLLPAPADGAPLRLVDIAAPVRNENGVVNGVLGAHLN